MNVKRIIFPTDFSPTGNEAMKMVVPIARRSNARVFVVHVDESPLAVDAGHVYFGEMDHAMQERMTAVTPDCKSIFFEYRFLTGDPAEKIVEFSKEVDADLIIMGTHGRTGLERVLLGSVAEGVVRSATCSVLTYKHSQKEPAEVLEL
jgi:universal stress protein A